MFELSGSVWFQVAIELEGRGGFSTIPAHEL